MLNISKEILEQDAVILKQINFFEWIQHPNSFLTLYDRWLDIRGIYIPIEKGFLLFLEEFFELSSNEGFKYYFDTVREYNDFSLEVSNSDSYFLLEFKTYILKFSYPLYNKVIVFYPNGYCPNIEKLCNILSIDYSLFKTIFYGE